MSRRAIKLAKRGNIVGSKKYLESKNIKIRDPLEKTRRLNKDGYWETAGGYLEHRRIYKRHYGKLPNNYHVHHIDECKTNNAIANLIAMPGQCHKDLHQFMRCKNVKLNRVETELFIEKWFEAKKKETNLKVKQFGGGLRKRKKGLARSLAVPAPETVAQRDNADA